MAASAELQCVSTSTTILWHASACAMLALLEADLLVWGSTSHRTFQRTKRRVKVEGAEEMACNKELTVWHPHRELQVGQAGALVECKQDQRLCQERKRCVHPARRRCFSRQARAHAHARGPPSQTICRGGGPPRASTTETNDSMIQSSPRPSSTAGGDFQGQPLAVVRIVFHSDPLRGTPTMTVVSVMQRPNL